MGGPAIAVSPEAREGACDPKLLVYYDSVTRVSFLGDAGYFPDGQSRTEHPFIDYLQTAFQLDLGAQCNLRCSYCCAPQEGRNPVAPMEELAAQAAAAARLDKRFALLLGGEPLLFPDLGALLGRLKDLGVEQHGVITNGTRLADAQRVDWLIERGCRVVILSYDDFDERRLVRLVGNREHPRRLDQALAHLIARMDRLLLVLQVCVCRTNYRHLADLVSHVAGRVSDAGADPSRLVVNLNNLQVNGRALDNAERLMVDLRRVIPEVERAIQAGRRTGASVLLRDFPGCTIPGFERLNTNLWFKDFFKEEAGPVTDWFSTLSVKKPGCAACRYDPYCSGFFPKYAELHGDRIFVPIE